MTFSTVIARRDVGRGYVAGAGVLTALAVALRDTGPPSGAFAVASVIVLGPLGLLALLVVVLPLTLIVIGPQLIAGAVFVTLAIGVAAANVAIARRITARGVPAAPIGGDDHRTSRRRSGPVLDVTLGITFFVLAGCAFVVLCFLDGFSALTAHGVDVPRSDAAAARSLLIVAWTWWPGLALAVAGLVAWIVLAARHRPLALWASIDLGVMIALDITSVAVGGS